MSGWYDESVHSMTGHSYLAAYLLSLVRESLPQKLGLSALSVVLTSGYKALTPFFWVVIMLWLADMIIGTARAWRDPKETVKLQKTIDGLMRLVVIILIPILLAMVEAGASEVIGVHLDGKAVVIALSIFTVSELTSVLKNAEFFMPRLKTLRTRLIVHKEDEDE